MYVMVLEPVVLAISLRITYNGTIVFIHTAVAYSEIVYASFDVRKSQQITINHCLIMSQVFIIICF